MKKLNIKINKKYFAISVVLIVLIAATLIILLHPERKITNKTISLDKISIEHLIMTADLALSTTGDVNTAMEYLLAAKKYINLPALDSDIAKLQAVPIVNIEELVLKIDTIRQQIDTLSMIPSKVVIMPTPEYAYTTKRFFSSIIGALKNIVIIRHQTIEPILPSEQLIVLRFNISAKLLQAELAASQKQNKLYHVCLAQAIDLISKYFVLSDGVAVNVLNSLQELQKINLWPNLPSLTESLEAIKLS